MSGTTKSGRFTQLLISLATLCIFSGWPVFGQTYTIQTLAGGGLPANVAANSVGLGFTGGVAVDAGGNLFIGNHAYQGVVRVDGQTGLVSLVAGNGTVGFSGDNGPASSAQLYEPMGVAVDSVGNVYVADSANYRIRKISNGVITTVAGTGVAGFSGDNGPATSAELSNMNGVAVDAAGNLYIADTGNSRVRKISNGVISTVAGNGIAGFSGDNGVATSAQLSSPDNVAVDATGNLYIADTGNNRVRKVTNGLITTVAAVSAAGVTTDSAGNVYIADGTSHIFKLTGNVITVVAGNGIAGFSGDNGVATSAQLNSPYEVAVDATGNLYIADTVNGRIRKVSNGVITTVAGGSAFGDNGPATSAQVINLAAVAVDSSGDVYIADSGNSRIREVTNGIITTVAGGGTSPGDNIPATSALLNYTAGVAVDGNGNLYIADSSSNRIRKVSNGVITTVAGTGAAGFSGDSGAASSARLNHAQGVAVDGAGNVYIADSSNNRVRMVSNGVITTIAGSGVSGSGGDNGLATSAQLNFPTGVAVDSAGNIYIAEYAGNRIRKVSNGVITTVAGNGISGFAGDNGPATSARLNIPRGVAVDTLGNIYIGDLSNHRVRKVTNGVITTVAGTGMAGFSGDNGPATSAQLSSVAGIAVDVAGNVYTADSTSNRTRVLIPVVGH